MVRKLFKEKFEDKKDQKDRADDESKGQANGEEEESSDFSLFRRLFRVYPEDAKSTAANENNSSGSFLESSPGTEKFFRKVFRDRDRNVENSELFGLKKQKEAATLKGVAPPGLPLKGGWSGFIRRTAKDYEWWCPECW